MNTDFITKDDLKTYKKILTKPNAHLNKYQPDGNINITRGKISGYNFAFLCETERKKSRICVKK